uniref:Uncharacterized protein n=1 Tax=Romanomermis culicivorax TaxID=13658 RepID=A0A915INM2_ROMCU
MYCTRQDCLGQLGVMALKNLVAQQDQSTYCIATLLPSITIGRNIEYSKSDVRCDGPLLLEIMNIKAFWGFASDYCTYYAIPLIKILKYQTFPTIRAGFWKAYSTSLVQKLYLHPVIDLRKQKQCNLEKEYKKYEIENLKKNYFNRLIKKSHKRLFSATIVKSALKMPKIFGALRRFNNISYSYIEPERERFLFE